MPSPMASSFFVTLTVEFYVEANSCEKIMVTPVPTLSSAGWVVTPAQKADYLMAHFYEAMNNQSYTFPGEVSSIQYVIEQNAGDIPGTCQAIQQVLEKYLSRYYPDVTVQVTSDDQTAGNPSSLVNLTVYITALDTNQRHAFTALIQTVNSKFLKAVNLNNTGQSVAASVVQQISS